MSITLLSFSRERRLQELGMAVQHCNLCERLGGRTKVLSQANGNVRSKILFIAEAPGRLGADRTGIPLFGDKTGENFENLLGNVGWRREQVFITNALLCNPRNEQGNNGTPSRTEIAHCSPYLEMTISLIEPDVVVPLGRTALDALRLIVSHPYELRADVGKELPWNGRVLFPLYHPGPRALVHRSLTKQRSDFMVLAKLVHPVSGLRQKTQQAQQQLLPVKEVSPTGLQQLILGVTKLSGTLSYFKLTKLLYLIDLTALDRLGKTITGEIYIRQQEGPWLPTLRKNVDALKGREITVKSRGGIPVVFLGPSPRFDIQLEEEPTKILTEVVGKYGRMGNAEIKTAVYRTNPMRYILEEEAKGRDMRKVPVVYGNKVSWELDKTRV